MSAPSTTRVRNMYACATAWSAESNTALRESNAAEFDAWLAEHDRAVKAEALREFARTFHPGDGNPWAHHVRTVANNRANKIEKGADA